MPTKEDLGELARQHVLAVDRQQKARDAVLAAEKNEAKAGQEAAHFRDRLVKEAGNQRLMFLVGTQVVLVEGKTVAVLNPTVVGPAK